MLFDRFRRRRRRQTKPDVVQSVVAAARTTGRDEALVYDVETGEVYYLLTKVKRRPGKASPA